MELNCKMKAGFLCFRSSRKWNAADTSEEWIGRLLQTSENPDGLVMNLHAISHL